MKARDKKLYEAFRALTIQVVKFFEDRELPSLGDLRLVEVVDTSGGGCAYWQEQVPNWDTVLSDHKGSIQALDDFEQVLQALEANEMAVSQVQAFYTRGDAQPLAKEQIRVYFRFDVVRRLLLSYLQGINNPVFDVDRFDAVYESLEEWLLTEWHTVRTISLLHCFNGPEQPIQLDEGIQIRRATDPDLAEIVNILGRQREEIWSGKSLLDLLSKSPKREGSTSQKAYETLRMVITALRLTKSGAVYCRFVLSRRKNNPLESSWRELPSPAAVSDVYELVSDEDIRQFHEVWHLVKNLTEDHILGFATRRFNFGYERWRVEDRIVDNIIGLEGLFVPDGGAGEIAYKLRTRAAALLGKDQPMKDRRNLNNTLKLSYELRSMLVHGSEPGELEKRLRRVGLRTLDELAGYLESCLRNSIKFFMERREMLDPQRMDETVLGLGGGDDPKQGVSPDINS